MPSLKSFVVKINNSSKDYFFFYGTSSLVFFIFLFCPYVFLHKFSDPYTTIKWISLLLCINLILFFFLFKTKKITFPKIPKVSLYILSFILCMMIINSYMHNVPLISYEHIRRFIFWGTAAFFFNFFCTEKEEGFLKIEKVIFLSSLIFIILALAQFILHPDSLPYLTLGNINLSAEFIGFSLAFQFGFLSRQWTQLKKSWEINLLTSLSFTYIYVTNCRSVIIGSILILAFSILTNRKFFIENLKIIILSIILIFSLKQLILLIYPDLALVSFTDKSSSFRWLLYTDTLQMIYKNPLGVGLGQFEFGALPYFGSLFPSLNERLLFSNPHDEFLYYLAEEGVILCFLLFLLGLSICYFLWNDIKKVLLSRSDILYFFIMLFVQALFQFPLLEPLPYFMTALMMGYFFFLLPTNRVSYELKRGPRVALIGLNFLATLIFIISFSAKYISFNFPYNEPLNKLACSYGNRNWLACLNVSYSYLNKRDYESAASYASRTLNWQPLNYQGLKFLGLAQLYDGNRRGACLLFNRYDSLFQNKSSLHDLIMKECPPPSAN